MLKMSAFSVDRRRLHSSMAWFTTDWSSSHHTVRCAHKSGDVINVIIVACGISSRLKWYKNYKNWLRLAKVIAKNNMSRFYASQSIYHTLLFLLSLFTTVTKPSFRLLCSHSIYQCYFNFLNSANSLG